MVTLRHQRPNPSLERTAYGRRSAPTLGFKSSLRSKVTRRRQATPFWWPQSPAEAAGPALRLCNPNVSSNAVTVTRSVGVPCPAINATAICKPSLVILEVHVSFSYVALKPNPSFEPTFGGSIPTLGGFRLPASFASASSRSWCGVLPPGRVTVTRMSPCFDEKRHSM